VFGANLNLNYPTLVLFLSLRSYSRALSIRLFVQAVMLVILEKPLAIIRHLSFDRNSHIY